MKKNIFLAVIVVLLLVFPFFIQRGASFNGADTQAKDTILAIDENYKPWFNSIWKPPSAETESLLFALQAAIGAGFIGYFVGYMRGKKSNNEHKEE